MKTKSSSGSSGSSDSPGTAVRRELMLPLGRKHTLSDAARKGLIQRLARAREIKKERRIAARAEAEASGVKVSRLSSRLAHLPPYLIESISGREKPITPSELDELRKLETAKYWNGNISATLRSMMAAGWPKEGLPMFATVSRWARSTGWPAYVAKARGGMLSPSVASAEEAQGVLSELLRDPQQPWACRIRAAELLLRSHGHTMVDRKSVV